MRGLHTRSSRMYTQKVRNTQEHTFLYLLLLTHWKQNYFTLYTYHDSRHTSQRTMNTSIRKTNWLTLNTEM